MHIVFVKHYLNNEGVNYVKTQWFPNVQLLLSQQNGYISVEYEIDKKYEDCLYITIKFGSVHIFGDLFHSIYKLLNSILNYSKVFANNFFNGSIILHG